ncbi:MAG: sugar phosphate isomerase/epimerase [Planctomycetes bacterium]|nr:sugar phosphate isomerase/epimerase [Planctomycetota bacterium]
MKLAFSSNAFREHALEDVVRLLAGVGYDGLELMCDAPHAWPPDVTPSALASFRQALREHRMGLSNLNAFMMCAYRDPRTGREGSFHWPSWVDDDEFAREARIRHTISCVEIAAELGVKTVSTEPGGPVSGRPRRDVCARFALGLERAARRAAELGVLLLIEPEPGLLIERGREFEEFTRDHVTFPGVGLNFDMGHFFCVGEDPAAMIRGIGRGAAHFHLEDIGADRVHHHLPPGEGAMDYDAIFGALADIGYQGWITVELYPFQKNAAEVAKRAFDRIRPYIA